MVFACSCYASTQERHWVDFRAIHKTQVDAALLSQNARSYLCFDFRAHLINSNMYDRIMAYWDNLSNILLNGFTAIATSELCALKRTQGNPIIAPGFTLISVICDCVFAELLELFVEKFTAKYIGVGFLYRLLNVYVYLSVSLGLRIIVSDFGFAHGSGLKRSYGYIMFVTTIGAPIASLALKSHSKKIAIQKLLNALSVALTGLLAFSLLEIPRDDSSLRLIHFIHSISATVARKL
ncbi:hypothetical protein ACOME3_003555 [Neoechinorhynchus agilis]